VRKKKERRGRKGGGGGGRKKKPTNAPQSLGEKEGEGKEKKKEGVQQDQGRESYIQTLSSKKKEKKEPLEKRASTSWRKTKVRAGLLPPLLKGKGEKGKGKEKKAQTGVRYRIDVRSNDPARKRKKGGGEEKGGKGERPPFSSFPHPPLRKKRKKGGKRGRGEGGRLTPCIFGSGRFPLNPVRKRKGKGRGR